MIKFFGEKLKEIKSKTTGKIIFVFDTKGEYITDDNAIIQRATGFFDHIELTGEMVGERVPKTFFVPPIVITHKDDVKPEIKEEIEEEVKEDIIPELTDEEIRMKAKDKGIGNWWNSKIEVLKEKLKEVS